MNFHTGFPKKAASSFIFLIIKKRDKILSKKDKYIKNWTYICTHKVYRIIDFNLLRSIFICNVAIYVTTKIK